MDTTLLDELTRLLRECSRNASGEGGRGASGEGGRGASGEGGRGASGEGGRGASGEGNGGGNGGANGIAGSGVHGNGNGRAARTSGGFVSLVGAGPGRAGLLTLQGLRCLRRADAVVYDRLAVPAIPLDLPDTVELHPVGKESGHHPVPQPEIHALLVRLARSGKRVVRLKGGDPFVFGRGGEEGIALRDAGIPFEVVPGVTSGISVPALSGIPVTHRGDAGSVTLVTAHEAGDPQVHWERFALDPHSTLVGYMGVSTLAKVSTALLAAGMDRTTKAAIIEQGTLSGQRMVCGTVADLAERAAERGIRPPAVFVIGKVVARAEALATVAGRPLLGARIALFGPAPALIDELEDKGAEVLAAPRPLTAAARLVLAAAPVTGWIVRTAGELAALEEERAAGLDVLLGTTLWCVGESGTELWERARQCGWSGVVDASSFVRRAAAAGCPPSPHEDNRSRGRVNANERGVASESTSAACRCHRRWAAR